MDEYKHYIRTDGNGLVIHGFTDAFEQPQPGDLLLAGQEGRHFRLQLTNERGQFIYRVTSGQLQVRPQTELDAEWTAKQNEPKPPSLEQQLLDLQQVVNDILFGGI